MKIRFLIWFSLLLLLFAYACGGSSEIEMKQARRAMEEATSVHAESLAPTDFEKAQTAWEHAQAAEKEGKTGAAKTLFSSASIFFGKASDIARAKSAALSRELDAMQPAIAKNIDQVRLDLSNKPLAAGQQSQVRALVSQIEEQNALIGKLMVEKDLPKAVAAAKELQTKIYHAQLILSGQKIK